MYFIVDIDGTVADISQRRHLIKQEPKDWDGFFQACDNDEPISEVISLVQALSEFGATLVFITGRSEAIRAKTIRWFMTYGVPCDRLYMRKEGDHREDNIVKSELLDQFLQENKLALRDIAGVFEDRAQVVKMYRERGLRVYQVAEGNF